MKVQLCFASTNVQVFFEEDHHELRFDRVAEKLRGIIEDASRIFSPEMIKLEKEARFALSVLERDHLIYEEGNRILIFRESEDLSFEQKLRQAQREFLCAC